MFSQQTDAETLLKLGEIDAEVATVSTKLGRQRYNAS